MKHSTISRRLNGAHPTFFSAIGVAIREGRELTHDDLAPGSRPVIVVNETLAQRHWGDQTAVGARIALDHEVDARGEPLWREIVGVVADVRHEGLDASVLSEGFMPATSTPDRRLHVLIKGRHGVAGAVRAALARIEPDLAMRFGTLRATVDSHLARPRLRLVVLLVLASMALALAGAGVREIFDGRDRLPTSPGSFLTLLGQGVAFGAVASWALSSLARQVTGNASSPQGMALAYAALAVSVAAMAGVIGARSAREALSKTDRTSTS